MKIIVPIKQVPFCDQLKFDSESRRIVREGVPSEINPFDKRALTQAINLKQQLDVHVTALTMGPPQAKRALVEALAMGADRAIHLLGQEFAGADTLATARALAMACRKAGFDLIICGKYSTDAETAQVPPELAELLDVPQVTGVTKLELAQEESTLNATREVDDGFEFIHTSLPCLITAAERLAKPIKVAPADLAKGTSKPILVWSAADLSADVSQFGISGSPTYVSQIYSIEPTRKHVIRHVDHDVDSVAVQVTQDLISEGLFGQRKIKAPKTRPPERRIQPREPGRDIWVVAELAEGQIRPVTFELLGRAIDLAIQNGGQVGALLIGHEIERHCQALAAHGADMVYLADDPSLESYLTEPYASILASAMRKYTPFAVLLPSTADGRDLAPRVAAQLEIGLTGDCIGLSINEEGQLVQLKPAFGGNIVAPILTRTRPAMATVRPGIFPPSETDPSRAPVVERLQVANLASRTQIIRREVNTAAGVQMDDADVIIGVGTGIGGPENLGMVKELASLLNAPIGATRKAVDAGWFPRQVQIGLTGRSISPRLYIALGIGGKFNHVVGIQRSGLILAVDKNPNAEIFKHADYGIVGELEQVVPALTRAIRAQHIQSQKG